MFGCTVDAVYQLAPEAERLTDPAGSALATPITESTVQQWIIDVSSALSAGIGDWADLTGDTLLGVQAAGRAVVACGAASYLEAARYPTHSSMNDSSYAGVLWLRYTEGMASLAATVKAAVDAGGEDVTPDVRESGPFGSFPPAYFADAPVQLVGAVVDPTGVWVGGGDWPDMGVTDW